jgi:signal peptidase II
MKLGNSNSISKFLNFSVSIIGLILIDQITKRWMSSRDFFVGFMHFHLVKNYGLSFGLNFGTLANFTVIALALILFVWYLRQNQSAPSSLWPAVFIIVGAVSNLCDRIALGYVRDFWDIGLNFTFNLADLYIFIGLLVLLFVGTNQEPVSQMPQKTD